jgi:hypothetical protein
MIISVVILRLACRLNSKIYEWVTKWGWKGDFPAPFSALVHLHEIIRHSVRKGKKLAVQNHTSRLTLAATLLMRTRSVGRRSH